MEDKRLLELKLFMRACVVTTSVCMCFASLAHTAKDSVAIQNSIDQYNAGTMKFDRFWNTYHDSAVYKIYLKQKGENHVRTTLDQAMEFIRATHDYSGGHPQLGSRGCQASDAPCCTVCPGSRCKGRAPGRNWRGTPWVRESTSSPGPSGSQCRADEHSSSFLWSCRREGKTLSGEQKAAPPPLECVCFTLVSATP